MERGIRGGGAERWSGSMVASSPGNCMGAWEAIANGTETQKDTERLLDAFLVQASKSLEIYGAKAKKQRKKRKKKMSICLGEKQPQASQGITVGLRSTTGSL